MSSLDLAAALEPLYRGYLRRLDEMAARLPADALLRESTTRGPLGEIKLGPDGLPLVFDVADLRNGETFEVRGARPDAPANPGGSYGALQIDLLPGNWEALPVVCAFDGAASDRELLEAAELVRAFTLLAAGGACSHLGGSSPSPWSGRLHSVQVVASGGQITATFDLGTCPPQALAILLSAFEGSGRDSRPIVQVTIGGAPPHDPPA